jgi:hypothetical protein
MYTAAAVSGGRTIPGRRNTQMWLKGWFEGLGRVKRKDVGEGEEVGVVRQGQPVGIWVEVWC